MAKARDAKEFAEHERREADRWAQVAEDVSQRTNTLPWPGSRTQDPQIEQRHGCDVARMRGSLARGGRPVLRAARRQEQGERGHREHGAYGVCG